MKDAQLIDVMRQAGIVDPQVTLQEARRATVPLPLACALLEQESSGGHNVFGHDPVANPVRGGPVTKKRYLEYKRHRAAGLGMQGVGPCQLTWYAYQDRADALGGCWKPALNMRVGFSVLAARIRKDGLRAGIRGYNGTGAAAERYADKVLERMRKWERLLGAPPGVRPLHGAPTAAPAAELEQTPPWPGRLIVQPPEMRGRDVRMWQQKMRARGWKIDADGVYGVRSATVCRRFQHEKGLVADGIVGPDTWRATWTAPVTPLPH